jgi:hypothetical protein
MSGKKLKKGNEDCKKSTFMVRFFFRGNISPLFPGFQERGFSWEGNTMKKFVIALMAVMMVAGIALAKPVLEKPVTPYNANGRAAEAEPNDDYLTANPLVVGDDMTAAIDPAGEMDFFAFTATAGMEITFETLAGDIGDTKMYLFDVDGVTQLDYDDDGGEGYYSLITYAFTADGTYFVQVIGYGATYEGTYILTATEADPPCPTPANNTCEGALPLPLGETFTFDNCGATNDYDPTSDGCTGYAAVGIDVVYYVDLIADQQFTISASSSYDTSIYLVTDCGDVVGSCMAGDDVYGEPEMIIFDAGENPGRYYMIFDGYSSTGEGIWEVTTDGVVATDPVSFDGLKALYR